METTGQEVGRIETRLRQVGTRLDRMLAKADEAGTQALREQITHAKDKHAVVQGKLNAFRAAHGEKWDNFRGSVEIAWRDLDSACKALAP